MKKKEIVELNRNLQTLSNLKGVKFSYAVAKNIEITKSEVIAIDKAKESDKEYLDYDKERVKLAESYSNEDEAGKPIIKLDPANGQYNYDIFDQKKFDKDLEKLRKKHKKAIDAKKKQEEDVKKLLEEEVKIDLHKINISDIPEEISVNQMKGIVIIIEE